MYAKISTLTYAKLKNYVSSSLLAKMEITSFLLEDINWIVLDVKKNKQKHVLGRGGSVLSMFRGYEPGVGHSARTLAVSTAGGWNYGI